MRSAPSQAIANGYLPHVDGLRGIAVLVVLLFHLGVPGFAGGFTGVDVFFVISGFLITRLILGEIEKTGTFSFRDFYLRRARRLLPAFLSVAVATTIAGGLLLSPAPFQEFGGSLFASLFGLANFYFWYDADYFALPSQSKPLLHMWSLGVEEQFYLLWPVTIWLVARVGALHRIRSCSAVLAALSFLLCLSSPALLALPEAITSTSLGAALSNESSSLFYLLPFRAFELLIGGMLAQTPRIRIDSPAVNDLLFIAGIALLACSVAFVDAEDLFPRWNALLPCGGAALLIVSGGGSRLSGILSNRIIVAVGLISYSLYLVHWPLLVLWSSLYRTPGPAATLVLGLSSIAIAGLNYRFIEQPWRDVTRYRRNKRAVLVFIAIFWGCVGVGFHIGTHQGWPWRAHAGVANVDLTRGAATFHRDSYGGAGYPYRGGVETETSPDVLLLGDSHARHYAEGLFRELTQPEGLALFIVAGTSCFHMPGLVLKVPGRDGVDPCAAALADFKDVLRNSQPPPVVLLSHAWFPQSQRAATVDEQGIESGPPIQPDDVIHGILRLKSLIGDAPLVVIGGVPTTGSRNLYDAFIRTWLARRLVGIDDAPLVSRPTPEIVAMNNALARGAEATGAYHFLNPHDALCRGDACRNLDDEGRLIYSDEAHLSLAGSRVVIRHFVPKLQAVLRERAKTP